MIWGAGRTNEISRVAQSSVGEACQLIPAGMVGTSGVGILSSLSACRRALVESWVSEKCLHLNILKRRVAGVDCCKGGESGEDRSGEDMMCCSVNWPGTDRRRSGRPDMIEGADGALYSSGAVSSWLLFRTFRTSLRSRSKVLRRLDRSGIMAGRVQGGGLMYGVDDRTRRIDARLHDRMSAWESAEAQQEEGARKREEICRRSAAGSWTEIWSWGEEAVGE